MARVSEDEVLEALRQVGDPAQTGNVVDLDMISGLAVRDGNVAFTETVRLADRFLASLGYLTGDPTI